MINRMEKGEIYKFSNPGSRHPFIFMRYINDYDFIGCMITHAPFSKRYPENILMDVTHFKKYSEEGDEYFIQYDSTNLVRIFLIKKIDEVDGRIWGELTSPGINFIESKIPESNIKRWSEK